MEFTKLQAQQARMAEYNRLGITGTKGMKMSAETIAKKRLYKPTDEAKEKIRKTMTGRKYSTERINASNEAQRAVHRNGKIKVWNKGMTKADMINYKGE